MLRKLFPEFIPCITVGKEKVCSRTMTFIFRRMDISFLSELVDEIPWETAVESKEAQDSFLVVENSLLQA